MRYLGLVLFLIVIIHQSCVPPSEQNSDEVLIDFTQPDQRQVIEWKDQRNSDSLIISFDSDDVTIRFLAAEAFGSMKAPASIQGLTDLLRHDPSDQVRLQAAYALGQSGHPNAVTALTESFGLQDSTDYNTPLRGMILEAVGKTGDEQSLELIAGISTYHSSQDQLLLGQMRAIYRFAQRGIRNEVATQLVIDRITNPNIPIKVRILASNYLGRFLRNPDPNQMQALANVLTRESDPEIKMGIANALAKTGDQSVLPVLLNTLMNDADKRVKCNILRSSATSFYPSLKDSLFQLILDRDPDISDLAAKAIARSGDRRNAGVLLNLAKQSTNLVRKSSFLSAALSPIPLGYVNTRNLINTELRQGLASARTPYERASFIESLSLDPTNYNLIRQQGLFSNESVVQTRAILALKPLLSNIRTLRLYRTEAGMKAFKQQILSDLDSLISLGDPGVTAAAATILKDPTLDFKSEIELFGPYRNALRNVKLPGATETQYELIGLLEYLEDTTYSKPVPAYNHPMDWSLLENISDSSEAYVITPKGQIKIKLLTSHAPVSVSNFIQLAQSNYFDSKYFHRVVPNFVIQGGCSRGDGYGGLDYTIRSELGPKYYDGPGYVGMASAGPDTEGTQWFITHSATPHLDGRYTIFGKVTDGMDIVDQIEVGDIIQDVRILKN